MSVDVALTKSYNQNMTRRASYQPLLRLWSLHSTEPEKEFYQTRTVLRTFDVKLRTVLLLVSGPFCRSWFLSSSWITLILKTLVLDTWLVNLTCLVLDLIFRLNDKPELSAGGVDPRVGSGP